MTKRNILTANFCKSVNRPGKYHDGSGLMLVVRPSGGKFWVQRVTVNGRRRELGCGRSNNRPARGSARTRHMRIGRIRPRGHGGNREQTPRTFRRSTRTPMESSHCVATVTRGKATEAKSNGAANSASMRSRLSGAAKVDRIQTSECVGGYPPAMELKRTATMGRVRGRMKTVFDWCIASGFRSDNPAGEAVTAILPKCKPATVHRKALHHSDVCKRNRTDSRKQRAHGATKKRRWNSFRLPPRVRAKSRARNGRSST